MVYREVILDFVHVHSLHKYNLLIFQEERCNKFIISQGSIYIYIYICIVVFAVPASNYIANFIIHLRMYSECFPSPIYRENVKVEKNI